MRQNRCHSNANSNKAAVITRDGAITIEGSNGLGVLTINGNSILIEFLSDPNAKIAEALVSCYLAEKAGEALISKSCMSVQLCSKIKTPQEIEVFKESIGKYLLQIGQGSEEADLIIQYLQNYIYTSNLFEALSVTKRLPNDHAVSIFNKEISHKMLSSLTINDIHYNAAHHTVAILGNGPEEGEATQEAFFSLHSTQ